MFARQLGDRPIIQVLAAKIQGQWLTTGDPLNWLKANIEFALAREDLGPEFRAYLENLKP